MLPFVHHVAVVGPVSAGKSTLLSALFPQMHSPMRVQRTTVVPQVHEETTDPATADAPDAVAKRNADADARYLADPTDLADAEALPVMRHRVSVIGGPWPSDSPLCDSLAQPSRFYAMASGLQDRQHLRGGVAYDVARSAGPGARFLPLPGSAD
jgi:hypothetical protein